MITELSTQRFLDDIFVLGAEMIVWILPLILAAWIMERKGRPRRD